VRASSGCWFTALKNTNNNQPAKLALNDLYDYYNQNLKLPNSSDYFEIIKRILENAKTLRNNSNYDALLMAHEYHHQQVTKDFVDLSQIMSEGAEVCLKIAAICFQFYVEHDQYIEEKRNYFKYL
jgi:hypothetical protein